MPRPKTPSVVEGADLSLGKFLMMPLFAAALSILMWTRLPTWLEAFESHRPVIEDRRDVFARLSALVPLEPVQESRCVRALSPLPYFEQDDNVRTNVAVFGPRDVISTGLTRQLHGEELYLSNIVTYLAFSASTLPPNDRRRMTRARIAREIEQPLEQNRYVLFYGTSEIDYRLKVDAFLFDVVTGDRVCDLTVTGSAINPVTTGHLLVAALHETAARASVTTRPRE